jgi:hypothetical protein
MSKPTRGVWQVRKPHKPQDHRPWETVGKNGRAVKPATPPFDFTRESFPALAENFTEADIIRATRMIDQVHAVRGQGVKTQPSAEPAPPVKIMQRQLYVPETTDKHDKQKDKAAAKKSHDRPSKPKASKSVAKGKSASAQKAPKPAEAESVDEELPAGIPPGGEVLADVATPVTAKMKKAHAEPDAEKEEDDDVKVLTLTTSSAVSKATRDHFKKYGAEVKTLATDGAIKPVNPHGICDLARRHAQDSVAIDASRKVGDDEGTTRRILEIGGDPVRVRGLPYNKSIVHCAQPMGDEHNTRE